jgi:murein DD-endopeptidase MepM/ murein hydrolase activator NlpD
MPPKTDNHKIYDDDIKKAELGNKQAIDKDTLSNKEAELISDNNKEKTGVSGFVENAKLMVTKNPKKSAGLGFGLFGLLSVVYLGVLSLGPLEVINLTENLKQTFFSEHEDASTSKTTKLIFYAKSSGDYTTTRLGVLGNLHSQDIDKKLAKSGVSIKNNGGNKFIYVFDATKGDNPLSEKAAKKQAEELQKAAARDGIKGKIEGHTFVIESEGKIFTSYKFINKYVLRNTLDVGKVQTALATRTLNKKTAAGKWNVFAKIDGKVNEQRNAVLKKLSEQLTGKRNVASAEGTKAGENATEEEKAAAERTGQTAEEGNTAKSEIKNGKSTASKFLGSSKIAGGISGAGLGLVCMLKAGVDDVDSANRKTAKMNTIRAFQKTVPLGDEAKSGEPNTINYQGLGEVVKLLRTDPSYKKEAEAQGLPVYETSAIQNYETTKYTGAVDTSGAKLPDEARQDLANSEIGEFLNNIQGLDGICKVLNSAVVAVISIAAAPVTGIATAIASPILMNAITNYFKDDAIDWTEKQYRGGPFKEAVYAGGREYSNQLWYQDGGRALTDKEIAQENEIEKQKYIAENSNKSIFEKYFDVYDSSTPVNQVALSLQKSPIQNTPEKVFSNFSVIINKKLSPKARAAAEVNDTDMYYGTRKAKITTEFLNKYDQPYETADKANNILTGPDAGKYKDLVKKCYGFEVDFSKDNKLDFKSINGTADDPLLIDPDSKEYPKECSNDNDENLNIIRDALNSTNNMKRFVCAEFNDSESCDEIMPEDANNQSGDVGEGGAFIQGDYAWPVGIFKKDLGSPTMPCPTTPPYCHHDDSPAFDLSTKNTKEAENMPVYAITDGKMWLTKNHGGVENCYNFHILGDDGYDYFYGHTKNPILKNSSDTKRVKKGDKVAEIGSLACGDNTINHLHLDQSKEYGHAVSSRTENLIKIMNDLYANLPDTAPESSESQITSRTGWQWPVRKSDFNGEITNCWRKPGHTGIDLGVGVGTPIYAAKAGTVVESGDGGDAGNFVMIKHDGGNWSNYQHLNTIIKKSGKVEAGELIGKSGNTGYSFGPHLHFSITDAQTLSSRTTGTNTLNPLDFLPKDGPGTVSCN